MDILAEYMQYMLDKISVDPKECPLFVADQNKQNDHKEKIVQLVFERFNSPAFFTTKKAVLSLFANGRTTGFIFESGAELTQVMPISDGFVLHRGLESFNLAGEHVTKKVLDLMDSRVREDLTAGRAESVLPYFDYQYEQDAEGAKVARLERLDGVRDSMRDFFRMRVARDAKEGVVGVMVGNDMQ